MTIATAVPTETARSEFATAVSQIDEWIAANAVNGAAIVVWQAGEIVTERYAGLAHPGAPVNERTLFALASVTKPIAAATVVTLVEAGAVALDEPVVRFVPEFGAPAAVDAAAIGADLEPLRSDVTLRHLLAHTSGLPEDLRSRFERSTNRPSLAEITDAMCRLPLQSAPGAEVRYSNAGYAILARIAERVAGEEFWSATRRRVLDPLGLANVVARPDSTLSNRIALVADARGKGTETESYNSAYWRELGIPWGGLYGTTRDLARFAGSFLASGPRLLSPPAVTSMTTDQTGGVAGGVESAKVRWPAASWGLGWEIKGSKRRHWTGDLTSTRTFCHFGQAGTLLWADPDRQLVVAVFANRTVTHLWPFVPARWARLSNAVVAAADNR
jgi:CubicO group peptidase (beta-lactamase class C family)